jgi:hypothetical protein
MPVRLEPASETDIPALVELRTAVSQRLEKDFGPGVWCSQSTEKGAAFGLRRGGVYVARQRGRLIATLTLSKRKPWAIDRSYFSPSLFPLYITGMAVDPRSRGRGSAGNASTKHVASLSKSMLMRFVSMRTIVLPEPDRSTPSVDSAKQAGRCIVQHR